MRTHTKYGTRQLLNEAKGNPDSTFTIGRELFEGLDSPVSLGLYLRLKYGEFEQLINKDVIPLDYNDGAAYFRDKTATSFLRKYPFTNVGNPAKVAKDNFYTCEETCRLMNNIFKQWSRGTFSFYRGFDDILFAARHKIHSLLGSFCSQEWLDGCRFGPGASRGVPGTSDYIKLSAAPSTTVQLEPYSRALLSEFPGWVRSLTYDGMSPLEMKVFPGGSYSQVPKDAKTNRNIEVQPLLNGFMQLGIGAMIRRRLRSVHIDLDDQGLNRDLARVGSITNGYATIDLSNASDTIAKELVAYLVPYDWLFAMDLCRTHTISIDGQDIPLQRYCSMGNGFAFELESLIFWAISKSACENVRHSRFRMAVYGDDIIVPTDCFSAVASALQLAGFTVNTRKSFSDGPFRESCGADWWYGRNVRPYFLKEEPTNVASYISLANGLKRLANRLNCNFGYDRRIAGAWFRSLRRIPPSVRKRIAFGITEHDDFILSGRVRDGKRVAFLPTKIDNLNWYPALATALYRCYRRGGSPLVTPRSLDYSQFSDGGSNGVIFDYRRNFGKWGLQRIAHDIMGDPSQRWW